MSRDVVYGTGQWLRRARTTDWAQGLGLSVSVRSSARFYTLVAVVVAIAAVYTGRAFMRQFLRSEDEAAGCAGCPETPNSKEKGTLD